MAEGYPGIDIDAEDYLDGEELDAIKALLAYLLMDSTSMDRDTIYSLVFQEGKKILWH